ncbi:MAG: radical SAM protein, partial [Maribacter sp.]|nr:radical SAM protein [Maribacter sp.]
MDINVDFSRSKTKQKVSLPLNIANHYLTEIHPQIQVTMNCNLGCTYCFQEHEGPVMQLNTAKTIIDQIVLTYYANPNIETNKPLEIYWHGGEPLIAGYGFFKGILDIQSSYPQVHFKNHIQTNATLMGDELASLFVDNGFHVGFSLDGPEDLHDLH